MTNGLTWQLLTGEDQGFHTHKIYLGRGMVARELTRPLQTLTALWKTRVQFPAPVSGSSQPLLTLDLGI